MNEKVDKIYLFSLASYGTCGEFKGRQTETIDSPLAYSKQYIKSWYVAQHIFNTEARKLNNAILGFGLLLRFAVYN